MKGWRETFGCAKLILEVILTFEYLQYKFRGQLALETSKACKKLRERCIYLFAMGDHSAWNRNRRWWHIAIIKRYTLLSTCSLLYFYIYLFTLVFALNGTFIDRQKV